MPPVKDCACGLWHPLHLKGQPWVNTVYRIPGPSTIDSPTAPAILKVVFSKSLISGFSIKLIRRACA